LYIYGGFKDDEKISCENLWCFDLKSNIWRQCETFGKGPGRRIGANSFVHKDKLYLYGGKRNADDNENVIFALDLISMEWKQYPQKHLNIERLKTFQGDICDGHLIVMRETRESGLSELCCWNIETNSWMTYEVYEADYSDYSHFVVFQKRLLNCRKTQKELFMHILPLENFPSFAIGSAEDQRLRYLFMNEEGSDITFEIEGDKTIPAHKEILIKKSPYFANLFNSGMIESRQKVIEIEDCEYLVFKEFLRFLYCNQVEFTIELVPKLWQFADKYVQKDIQYNCINFLTLNIRHKTVTTILDFAREQDILHLKNSSMNFLKNKISSRNVFELVQHVEKQNNPKFAQEDLNLRKKAFNIILQNYIKIFKNQKQNLQFYQNFLIKNININTIEKFAKLISSHPAKYFKTSQKLSEQDNINLKEAVLMFIRENFKEIKREKIHLKLPNQILIDALSYVIKKLDDCEKKILKQDEVEIKSDLQPLQETQRCQRRKSL